MTNCPCCSGLSYETCCGSYHQGVNAPNALALMRSRYSAYKLGLTDYILETTHPNHPDRKIPLSEKRAQIEAFSKGTVFKKLEIRDFEEKGTFATVTFFATLRQGEKDASFGEKSTFEKVNGRWLYLSGSYLKS
jgi:SEC-C motif-containing protein